MKTMISPRTTRSDGYSNATALGPDSGLRAWHVMALQLPAVRPQVFRIGFAIVGVLVLLPGMGHCQESVTTVRDTITEEQLEHRLVDELIQRRLFDLARFHCEEQLSQGDLGARPQALWTIDLLKTLTAAALAEQESEREPHWQELLEIGEDFLRFYPEQPFRVLVQVQLALSWLARGNLATAQLEAGEGAEMRAVAEESLRQAAIGLSDADETVDRLLPAAPPAATGTAVEPTVMTKDELLNLRTNITFQAARVEIDRSLLVGQADDIGRLELVRRAEDKLNTVASVTNPDQPLWWQVQIELARCARLGGDLERAEAMLESLELRGPSPQLQSLLRQQQLELAIAAGSLKRLRELVKQSEGAPTGSSVAPQLQLLRIRGCLILADAASNQSAERRDWQQLAVAIAEELQRLYGGYWGRRGNRVISDSLGGKATSETDAQLLVKVGSEAERNEQWDDAIAAYRKAAAGLEPEDTATRFQLLYRVGLIQQEQGESLRAADTFGSLATELPQHEKAATASMLCIWNWAQARRAAPGDEQIAAAYARAIATHLQLWPSAENSGQVRLWQADLLIRERQYREALTELLLVSRDDPHFARALEVAEQIVDAAVESFPDSKPQARRDYVLNLSGLLESNLADEPGQLPPTWDSATRRLALLLTQVNLKYLDDTAKNSARLLEAAIASLGEQAAALEDRNWLARAHAWLVVAKTAAGEPAADITPHIRGIDQAVAWQDLMTGLSRLENRQTDSERIAVINQLRIVASGELKSRFDELPPEQRLQWSLAEARARLASGEIATAIALAAPLAKRYPQHAPVRLTYATALSKSDDDGDWQQAIAEWRRIAAASQPQSERWFQAKYNVAELLFRSGQHGQARKMLEYLKLNPPGWSQSRFADRLETLLLKSRAADQ